MSEEKIGPVQEPKDHKELRTTALLLGATAIGMAAVMRIYYLHHIYHDPDFNTQKKLIVKLKDLLPAPEDKGKKQIVLEVEGVKIEVPVEAVWARAENQLIGNVRNKSTDPDGELIALDSLNLICEYYRPRIFGFFDRLMSIQEAEHLTQITLLRMAQHTHRFIPLKPYEHWVFKTAKHLYLNYRRDTKKESETTSTESDMRHDSIFNSLNEWFGMLHKIVDEVRTPEEELFFLTDKANVVKGFYWLTSSQQQVIIHRFIYDMSIAETAGALTMTEGQVKGLQHRALQTVKRFIEQENGVVSETSSKKSRK